MVGGDARIIFVRRRSAASSEGPRKGRGWGCPITTSALWRTTRSVFKGPSQTHHPQERHSEPPSAQEWPSLYAGIIPRRRAHHTALVRSFGSRGRVPELTRRINCVASEGRTGAALPRIPGRRRQVAALGTQGATSTGRVGVLRRGRQDLGPTLEGPRREIRARRVCQAPLLHRCVQSRIANPGLEVEQCLAGCAEAPASAAGALSVR